MKAYLLVFNQALGIYDRQVVLDFLDSRPTLFRNWFAPLTNMVIVISDSSMQELRSAFQAQFPGVYFIIAEVNQSNTDGWLPKASWQYINNPTPIR